MHWLNTLDARLFHWVNPTLSNPALDVIMPFLSANAFFAPVLLIIAVLMLWKGGARGRLCVIVLVAAVALSDGVICSSVKQLIHRPRPFLALADVHVPAGIGRTDSGSMPSAHTSNWFAATLVAFVFYRRSIYFMLPLALAVGFSRIYNGVHYPGDVLAGALTGMGAGAAAVWGIEQIWRWVGSRWFPLWWREMPSILGSKPLGGSPHPVPLPRNEGEGEQLRGQQWLRLGYVLIVLEIAANLGCLASGRMGLSGDEAYQWVWSKHLALSYYSKPPLIAVAQWIGTSIWGDNQFGVRFLSPVISAVLSLVLLRFVARVTNPRAAFWLTAIMPAMPLLAAGSMLMTVDPLSVMFWTLAMVAGWKAAQDDSTTGDWLWVGLWMGLGFLSKYTAFFQWLCWAFFFLLWPPARRQLRKPGPYAALAINALCTLPVLIWNAQHGWITFRHVAEDGGLNTGTPFSLMQVWHGLIHYTTDFISGEAALLNPFIFLPMVWAAVAFWHRRRENPLQLYFFCMGAPLFLFYFAWTLHSRVYLNWIVPSVLPLLCLAVAYWDERWQRGFHGIRHWLSAGLMLGLLAAIILRDSDVLTRIMGKPLPPRENLWARVEGWDETAQTVEGVRKKFETEGKPVFIIGGHYQITGELTFNLPEAKAAVRDHPFIFFLWSAEPQNQFYFWPGYEDDPSRKGQNALYVREYSPDIGDLEPPPDVLKDEFQSLTDLGEFKIVHNGELVRRLQIIECRNLR